MPRFDRKPVRRPRQKKLNFHMGTWNVQEDAVNLLGIRNWEADARNREEFRRIVVEAMTRKRAEAP